MDIERLIECVRKHVFLYDLTHVDYKNVKLKTAAWEAIGNELNQSADAVRAKWKTLRDAYTKHKKVAKSATGSNIRLAPYLWSTQLSFLDYHTPPYNQTQELGNSQEFHKNLPLWLCDGVDHLFLSYAETFKRFPPREQVLLKLELAKLFSNTELKLLENENSRSQYTSVTQYANDWIHSQDIKTEADENLKIETDLSEEI